MKTRKNEQTIVLIGLLVALLTLTVSCECTDDEYMGPSTSSGVNGVSEIRDLEDFHSISAAMVGKILLTQGPVQEIRLVAQPEILYDMETIVIDGVLEMKMNESMMQKRNVEDFTAWITLPDIRSINLIGVGELVALNDLHAESLVINRTGVSNITLRGEAKHLEITSTGIGNVSAFDLTSQSCNIHSAGFGNVEVTVTEDLWATLSGFGTVFYKGNPSLNTTISGTGKLINAN